jgi:hypothetical protein
MSSAINFIELENQVISATYRNRMIGAMVVLVDATSESQLADPVIKITSPAPNGSLRMRLPASLKPGAYFLRALNGHGKPAAQSVQFSVGLAGI